VRVTLVQEHWFTDPGRQLQLAMKGLLLQWPRRKIAEVVETAFAGGDHLGLPSQLFEVTERFGSELGRVMGMHAGGGEQCGRPRAGDFDGFSSSVQTRAGHHHLRDAYIRGPLNHGVPISVVAVMTEIDTDID
jgi:hypothetical protein